MKFPPTAEQTLILTEGTTTDRNLIVNARAGAAKTTTIEMLCAALPKASILCLAFNKKIADELRLRLPANVECKTLHSMGLGAWKEFVGRRPVMDNSKTYKQLTAIITDLPRSEQEELRENFRDILDAVGTAKAEGYLPSRPHPSCRPLIEDDTFYDLLEFKATPLEREIIDRIVVESFQMALLGQIDFDDMILCPTIMPTSFPLFNIVMIDEAQDLSPINHLMLRKIVRNRRLIAVGDPCQPSGTQITLVDKPGDRWNQPKLRQVPIEEVVVGDTVLGYNGEGAFLFNRKVEGISVKPFSGYLTDVVGEGIHSRYTPNHHCYASFSPLRKHYAVYLMQKGDKFRVGRAKMDYGDMGAGPIVRARAEKADALWLLSVKATESDAALEEAYIQASFGLPDLTFISPNANIGLANQTYLDSFWGLFEQGFLENRAFSCLNHYGKSYAIPLWTKEKDYFSLKRPMVIQACNLLPGVLMLPYAGKSKITKNDWRSVDVGKTPYEGLVYSFTVSDNQLYVADNLVTHNCQAIYGFRGASENSMSELRLAFDMTELYLTICFRSAQTIVKEARWRAPDMQWRPNAPEGEVISLPSWSSSTILDGDAIICRNNAPLFRMALELLKVGRFPELGSDNIVKGLLAAMKKFGPRSLESPLAMEELRGWEAAQKVRSKNPKRVTDQAACIAVFIQATSNLGEAMSFLQEITSRKGRIKLMTGHKSKGLEFDRVFFLDQQLLRPAGQDRNLRYVIQTRARESLIYVESEGWTADAPEAVSVT